MLNEKIRPMLAHSAEPFDSSTHLYEPKWDGTRCVLHLDGKNVRLQNRRLSDISGRYPELEILAKNLNARNAVLDGELVVLSDGKPDFGKLQQREHIRGPLKVSILSRQMPATYVVFDLLYLDDEPRTSLPLESRKELLERILVESPRVMESLWVREKGILFFRQAVELGLEGVMAKRMDSPYLIGKRSRHWLKIKPRHSSVCYVVGYTEGRGHRRRFLGALAVATKEKGTWKYRGKVGSGFTDEEVKKITENLQGLRNETPAFPELKRLKGIQWVLPRLRCEVVFQEYTGSGHYRAPVFKGLVG